jgi:CMP-N-acetylneuraminic acid synthetase
MSVVALICARGGSKGLQGKNIRLLRGRPLIAWAIEQARAVERVDRVIVSTDSPVIAGIARASAEVPFLRPEALALDESAEWLVWRHALEYLHEHDGGYPSALLVVPTTAPLRDVSDLDRCLDEYLAGGVDVVLSVSPAHRNPYFNMVTTSDENLVTLVNPPVSKVFRRQDAPEVFDITTVGYVARPEFVMTASGIFSGRVRKVTVPVERALDIDTAFDFQLAEMMLELRDKRSDAVS